MMKKILAALTLVLSLGACNDQFMERHPIDDITNASYWKSVNDLELYVNAFYPHYIYGHSYGWATATDFRGSIESHYLFGDIISDNMATSNYNRTAAGQLVRPNNAGSGGWSWSKVREINIFFANYEKAKTSSKPEEQRKQNLLGEMQLFKAWEYAEKAKAFGDVPWLDEVLETDSESLTAKPHSRSEVIAKVVALLDQAIINLPEKGSEVSGRLNKDVATHLQARICLHEGTFRKYHGVQGAEALIQKAADAANVLISSNRYAIERTGSDPYNSMFRQYDYSTSPEVILQKIYKDQSFGHASARYWAHNGRNLVGATKSLVDEYLCADGKTIFESGRSNEFIKDELTGRDPRLTQTIGMPGPNYVWQERPVWEQRSILNGMIAVSPEVGGYTPTGYWVVKWYLHDKTEWERVTMGLQACPVFRYAETLLIYAEAKAELGQCDQTVIDLTINALRDRVSMPHLMIGSYPNDPALKAKYSTYCTYVPSDLLLEIRRERRVELAIENFRYDDLMRWAAGRFLTAAVEGMRWNPADYYAYDDQGNVVMEDGQPRMAVKASADIKSAGTTVFFHPTTQRILPYAKTMEGIERKFEPYMYVFPIPTEDMVLNPNLTSPWPAI